MSDGSDRVTPGIMTDGLSAYSILHIRAEELRG